ncbi:ribonuclease H2 subunit B [Klebsormidium nitens]|uniref:Ribonuclease H2 subunit B n=1 Tax=Klebsormidium nitens TaxID=105231 RepID=A0A1Y1HMV5_KLENI|nr:ribonuclease H2 subunit B [Klebsormidium nitens]|eukprot:GAQ78519.1 ribonuclease H2 subunit B [Klebsormidium nitens]
MQGDILERRVLITYDQKENAGTTTGGEALHLRHPKTAVPSLYLLIREKLQEVHWFKQQLASWFIGESVSEDGSLYLSSPVDPLFIALPLLEQARMKKGDSPGMFRGLEEMLEVEGFPGYQKLFDVFEKTLDMVCEVREAGDTKYYRLDDFKALAWLCCKVEQASAALKMKGGKAFHGLSDDELRTYSIGLLSEYLPAATWMKRLSDHYGVDLDAAKKARVLLPVQPLPCAPPPPPPAKTVPVAKGRASSLAKKGPQPGDRKITSFFARPR